MACTCLNPSCTQSVNNNLTYCTCLIIVPPTACPDGCEYNALTNQCICTETANPIFSPVLTPVDIKDYLEEINWTISYDPKLKIWLSFHDWHPEWLVPSYNHFLTIKTKPVSNSLETKIWRHNVRTDSYANYYGDNYPWEIEYQVATPNTITTLRNIEYTLDVYKYFNNGKDAYHKLDENFDRVIIYNSEQISGTLLLNLKTKNNPLDLLNYPFPTANGINIQYSKEENKFRLNQFFDVTNDRGEFTGATIPMWVTALDGYHKVLNPVNTNYFKPAAEHKKFRHYGNKIILRRNVSGENKMILKFVNNKYLLSPR
jgi:hypothetical protein